jgi:hypothetical protein
MAQEFLSAVAIFEGEPARWQPAAAALLDAWGDRLGARAQALRLMSSTPGSARPRDWRFLGSPRASARSWAALLRQLDRYNLVMGAVELGEEPGGLQFAQQQFGGGPSPRVAGVGLGLGPLAGNDALVEQELTRLTSLLDDAIQSPGATQAFLARSTWNAPGGDVLRTPFEERWGAPYRGTPWLRGLGTHVWLAPPLRSRVDEHCLASVARLMEVGAGLRVSPRPDVSESQVARAFAPLISEEGLARLG